MLDDSNQATLEAAVDVAQVEALGTEVVRTMQGLRELLEARADALEHCRAALEEHHGKLREEMEAFEVQETQLCEQMEQREAGLSERENRCLQLEGQIEELSRSREQDVQELSRQREELQAGMEEIEVQKDRAAKLEASLREMEKRLSNEQEDIEKRTTMLDAERERLDLSARRLEEESAKLQEGINEGEAKTQTLAQAEANLQQEQEELRKDQESLAPQREAVTRQLELCKQHEAEMTAMGNALEQRNLELDRRESDLAAMQRELEGKMAELKCAHANLTELQKQLGQELSKVADSKNELLPVFGFDGDGLQVEGPAAGGQALLAEQQARKSIERFQKLCRDAKRRAIESS